MRMPIQTAGVPRTVSQTPENPNVQPQIGLPIVLAFAAGHALGKWLKEK